MCFYIPAVFKAVCPLSLYSNNDSSHFVKHWWMCGFYTFQWKSVTHIEFKLTVCITLCGCTECVVTLHVNSCVKLSIFQTCCQSDEPIVNNDKEAEELMRVWTWNLCCSYKCRCEACCTTVYPLYCNVACKFSFIPHSYWLPANLFLSVGSSVTEILPFITAWLLVMECHLFTTLTQNWKFTCQKHLCHLPF